MEPRLKRIDFYPPVSDEVKLCAKKHDITELAAWLGCLFLTLGRLAQRSNITIALNAEESPSTYQNHGTSYSAATGELAHSWQDIENVSTFLKGVQSAVICGHIDQLPALTKVDNLTSIVHCRQEQLKREPNEKPTVNYIDTKKVNDGRCDISIATCKDEKSPHITIDFDEVVCSEGLLQSFSFTVSCVMQQLIEQPFSPLGSLYLTPGVSNEFAAIKDASEKINAQGQSVVPKIIEVALANANRIAVSSDYGEMTYSQLLSFSTKLAAQLQSLGVKKGDRIAVLFSRDYMLPATLLGILLSGAAYVPVDPDYPAARNQYIIASSNPSVILTNIDSNVCFEGIPIFNIKQLMQDDSSKRFQQVELKRDDISHIIFTSGSTGKPKGVVISHGSVLAMQLWADEVYERNEFELVYSGTSICFDLSVFEFFVTLSLGGRIHVALNALQLIDDLARLPVSLINTVPSLLTEILQFVKLSESVKVVNLAGEALPLKLARHLVETYPQARLLNLYGPTEDTTYSTWYEVPIDTNLVFIGKPLNGTVVKICDQWGRELPAYFPGEIYLAGTGLALGYWKNESLSKQKFIDSKNGQRFYKTGDIGRMNGGNLEYLGRADEQVKLNGYRIELNEIDNCLLKGKFIKQSASIMLNRQGKHHLCSFISCVNGDVVNIEEILILIRSDLPEFMQPSFIQVLDKLPLLNSGKKDKKSLADLFVASENIL